MAFTFTSAAVLTQTRVLVSFMTLLNISDKSQENSIKKPYQLSNGRKRPETQKAQKSWEEKGIIFTKHKI